MKKSIVLALVTAAVSLVSFGCSASARVSVPNGSIAKPAKDVQVAYVTADRR